MDVAHSHLSKVRGLMARQRSARDALEQQISIRDNLQAIDYATTKVAGTSPDDRLVEIIERLDDLIAQYRAALADWVCSVDHTRVILQRMDSQLYAAMLESHYIDGITWAQTGEHMGYSEDGMYKLRPYALIGFYDAMTNYETGAPEAI